MAAWDFCGSCCPHGQLCTLPEEHEGLHDSRWCQWTDAEAIAVRAAVVV